MNKAILAGVALVFALPASAAVLGIGKNSAEAVIINTNGLPVGKAKVVKGKNGLKVALAVRGLSRGEHGVHLHTTGKCEGPNFGSAGGHWNPGNRMHGLSNPDGSHAGDLPNLLVAKNGRGKLSFEIEGGSFRSLIDDDGAAIIIHANSDDQRTDPNGNSGDRVACGILRED
jgi:superoxide dismutase, Cu-Zn family